jgi:hypothetical protein
MTIRNPITKSSARTGKQISRNGRNHNLLTFLVLTGIAIAFITVTPVSAADGTQYLAGSPALSAAISGSNELTPGKEVQLGIVIQNTGINQFKFVRSNIVNRDDLPNTAKFLTVGLGAGDSPIIVKSDPQLTGDLAASSTATATFTVKVPSDAAAGTYLLPVYLNYTYLYTADQYGSDTIEYRYKSMNETLTIPVKIKADVRLDVESVKVSGLNAGTEGYVTLTVKNIGHEDGKKAILTIAQNDGSPITPTEGSAYIGDFPAGGTATAIFRTSVDSGAEEQTYPLDVYVKYENSDGDTVSSDIESIGIPVGGKIRFAIVSDPQTIAAGQKKVITAQFKNTGGATAYQAVGRISMVDPFSSNDDSAFLGDLAPGETKEASFLVTADGAATVKSYGIDAEVRYRDALDNQVVSDPMKLTVEVVPAKNLVSTLTGNPALLALIILVIITAAGFYIYRRKKLQ